MLNYSKKKAFYSKFLGITGVWMLLPPIMFFITRGLNDGKQNNIEQVSVWHNSSFEVLWRL